MPDCGPLFIVDNAPKGRKGMDCLREWSEIATKFDIATGFLDIGALLALDATGSASTGFVFSWGAR